MDGIYLRHGDSYVAMRETPYDAEHVLQELIERHPEMLAGGDESRQSLILVRREAGVSDAEDAAARWSLDDLYSDRHGIPTLVEVKRSSDTRNRREVVAQMLDYAAHARSSFNVERMADWLAEAARQRGSTGAETLLEVFGVEDVDGFWQGVDTNLKAERLRLVFVSDRSSFAASSNSSSARCARPRSGDRGQAVHRCRGRAPDDRAAARGRHSTGASHQRPAARGELLHHDQVVARLQ